ncbi:hypothetical protein DICPUDRAFT_81831 [Dictyostelium purpureum]|uniref:Ribosomal protein/NADH dehydrogenase domain-containing protein n=1 Tax=Dictyostelium purpureum TaxID=5786 RepID=F0ZUQ4_DICPU|nr:uncharacterized protein DICPUDRAFT_81831 [Dictyostelium purpureum]EGC32347.1 hypothetical protein DICPUDRAFT_81831 [Dictyostelium purpureum]|eukprot:XP_003291149.1 hypothetical protein DICPUDRAFT_81831 [Dictyostelium purpureum]
MAEKLNILTKLKSITFSFNPLCSKSNSIKSFIPLTTNSRSTSTVPDCKIQFKLGEEFVKPEILLKFSNGSEQTINTSNLEVTSIIESIDLLKRAIKVEEIEKIKTSETTLQEILQPVNKKKDTGAKANR